jgi:hypothetical protein
MHAHLRAGIAIYNAGEFHAAHDAWEEPWLDLERDTADERLLHGLIQFTAAIYHAAEDNADGATGLATSAREYLDGLEDHRGVNVAAVRGFLARIAADPSVVHRADPPPLTLGGDALALGGIEFDAGAIVAHVLAGEYNYDEEVIERAISYARRDLRRNEATSPIVTLTLDFARNSDRRPVVFDRLRGHVDRRDAREADLDGLFETGDRRRDE